MNEIEYYMKKNVKMSSVKWRFGCTVIPVVLVV